MSVIPIRAAQPFDTVNPAVVNEGSLLTHPLDHLARNAAALTGAAQVLIVAKDGEALHVLGSSCGSAGTSADLAAAARVVATGEPLRERAGEGGVLRGWPIRGANRGVILLRSTTPGGGEPVEPLGMLDLLRSVANEMESLELRGQLREAREAEAESHTRWRELTETVGSGIALIGANGIMQEINGVAAEILGRPASEVVGRPFADFIAKEEVERALADFTGRLDKGGERRESELRIVRPTGEVRLLQMSSSPIVRGDLIVGVFFSGRDITEERSRESQLRRAERLASVAPLLSGVCHELNNPLTSIKSFAELMLLDERGPDDREALEIVQREAARAAQIVTDLRLVARQTQEEGSSGSPMETNELVREACNALGVELKAAGIDLQTHFATDLPPLYGVRPQIERVLVQLLSNAVHALREHTKEREIRIRTYACELGVAVRVEDTGPGISPEHLDHIFDPFWTTRSSGSGLGLSLAHSIVTDHGGRIRVEAGWGRGAVFTLELPGGDERVAPPQETSVPAQVRNALRILVVDDEGPIRFTLKRYLERRGHVVLEAEEGGAALTILEGDEPAFDIIVADLRMPGLGGEELFGRLRERGDGLEQRLIFITGDADSPDAAPLLQQAGVPVMLKPFELAEIAQIIETHADVCAVR